MESPATCRRKIEKLLVFSVMSTGYKSRPGEFLVFTLSTSPSTPVLLCLLTNSPSCILPNISIRIRLDSFSLHGSSSSK